MTVYLLPSERVVELWRAVRHLGYYGGLLGAEYRAPLVVTGNIDIAGVGETPLTLCLLKYVTTGAASRST